MAGDSDVVVPHHGDVFGYVPSQGAQRTNGLHRQQIARRKHRVERSLLMDHLRNRLAGAALDEGRAMQQFRSRREPVLRQRLPMALVAVPYFRQFDVAEERDAAAALCDEVIGGELAARDVVAADGAIQLLLQLRAPHHEGRVT